MKLFKSNLKALAFILAINIIVFLFASVSIFAGEPEPLPTSGSEVAYEPSKWNDGGKIQYSTNCYAYGLNLQRNPITLKPFPLPGSFCLQPGELTGKSMDISVDDGGQSIIDACTQDATAINGVFIPTDRYVTSQPDTYKVALVIAPGYDYHWYRQNPDGTWSHKPGTTRVKNTDDSYKKILDPQTANRGPYTTFVGYFSVKSIPAGAPYASPVTKLTSDNNKVQKIETSESMPPLDKSQMPQIKKGMSIKDVQSTLGLPQKVCGSGIIMDSYNLSDGNSMVISYGVKRDKVNRVFLFDENGNYSIIVK